MQVPQSIGQYKINCLVSTLFQRRLFISNDQDGKNVVLKESLNNHKELIHEYDILAKLDNPNIIKPIELIDFDNKYYIVMPRADTDLSQFMKTETISDDTIRQIMYSLLSAIEYLQILGIWHRNITPDNILIFNVNQETKFVLADFKLAINYTGTKNDDFRVNYQYMAPEIIDKKGYTNKIDCWSAGIIMYQLYKHTFPNDDASSPGTDPIDMTDIPLRASDLISHLFCADPSMRYSASEALKHPYFNKFH